MQHQTQTHVEKRKPLVRHKVQQNQLSHFKAAFRNDVATVAPKFPSVGAICALALDDMMETVAALFHAYLCTALTACLPPESVLGKLQYQT